ncbi:hypothetical protein Salat_1099100 [Sesamum alatum]|uniref:Uncharacterized protein n=1 Tax=Sesamum alatum TaxID=300844 RepID=A0AAE2CSZ2_9LAMI|nr:hypothetical protein Salat_1099100 [Sesamum alatum]
MNIDEDTPQHDIAQHEVTHFVDASELWRRFDAGMDSIRSEGAKAPTGSGGSRSMTGERSQLAAEALQPQGCPLFDLLSSLNSSIYSHLSNRHYRAHLKEHVLAAAVPTSRNTLYYALNFPRCRRRRTHLKESSPPPPRPCLHPFSPLSTLRDSAAATPPQGTHPVTVDGYNEET